MTMTIKRSEGIDWCQMFGDFDAETRFRLDKMPTLVSAEADSDPILPIPDYQSQSDTTITNTDPDPNLCPYLALTLV